MIQLVKQVLALSFLFVFAVNCNNDDDITPTNNPFEAISDIATFHGNLESNTVIVNTQGGPFTSLQDETLNEFIELAQIQLALVVNVHQEQTKNPDDFKNSDITFEQAKQYDLQSVAKLKKVVDFFKNQADKKVYVLGISFGSFMTEELIATHGIDVADGYMIIAGRLDIDSDTWEPFSQGKETKYEYDSEGNYTVTSSGEADSAEVRNMAKLAAGLGFNRYSDRLNSISDLSKITYIYGDRDEAVGKLSANEILFLKGKGAKVGVAEGGNHSQATAMGLTLLKNVFDIE